MTNETKGIPLLVALEYMARVNNLLNHLIREDKFPAILFAQYDRTFQDLLKMAQIMNFKFKDAGNDEMAREATAFMDNLDKWEDEYREAINTKPDSELGITKAEEDFDRVMKMSAEELVRSPEDAKHLERKVKDVLGKDLFGEVLSRIESKSREQALSRMMEDMVDKGDLDDEVAN